MHRHDHAGEVTGHAFDPQPPCGPSRSAAPARSSLAPVGTPVIAILIAILITAVRAAVLAVLLSVATVLTAATASATPGVAVLYRVGPVRPYLCTAADRAAYGLSADVLCVIQPIPASYATWRCFTTTPIDRGPWFVRGRLIAC